MSAEQILAYIVFPIASYLIGSLTPGYWIGKLKGVDLRAAGSKNIGATNVARVLGKKLGIAVFAIDLLKGFAPTLLFAAACVRWSGVMTDKLYFLYGILYGVCAILGHLFPIYAGFRGGKGVATGCGVFLALSPWATLTVIVVWGIVFAIFRIVSIASILAAIVLPVGVLMLAFAQRKFSQTWPVVVFAGAVAVLVLVRHRSNIARLAAGTENRFEGKSQ